MFVHHFWRFVNTNQAASTGVQDIEFNKLEVARRQLGTALQLFLDDQDPVSVHVLANGAIEICTALVKASGQRSFKDIAIHANPVLTERLYNEISTQYWNSFKHYGRRDGLPRDDSELFAMFSDEANDFHLFMGWHDYGMVKGEMPLEAQCFQAWFFALKEPDGIPGLKESYFPDIHTMSRRDQKRLLEKFIKKYKRDHKMMAYHRREQRNLLLPNNLDSFER